MLTSLGFSNRKRTNSGWSVLLNREDAAKVHELVGIHGIDNLSERYKTISPDDCDLCRAAVAKRPNVWPEVPKGQGMICIVSQDVLNKKVLSPRDILRWSPPEEQLHELAS